jgi:hypothetical protein
MGLVPEILICRYVCWHTELSSDIAMSQHYRIIRAQNRECRNTKVPLAIDNKIFFKEKSYPKKQGLLSNSEIGTQNLQCHLHH